MMVDRSTWCSAAASAIVTSCRTSCNQISYFWETDRNRFARLPARSVPRSDSDMIRSSTIGRRTRSMLSDPGRDLYHEVRRKPRSTKCCLCRDRGVADAEVVEEGLHVDPEGLVVAVDGGPDRGCASEAWAADAGQDGRGDVLAQSQQRRDGAGSLEGDLVAAAASGFGDEVLPAELVQVVGRSPDGVLGLAGHVRDLGR